MALLLTMNAFSGNPKKAEKYRDKGIEYYNAKQYDKALPEFLKYAKEAPNDFYPYYWLAWTYYFQNRYQEALANFKTSNSLLEFWDNYKGLAFCYEAFNDYETALRYNLKYAKLVPKNYDQWHPHNSLGWNYYFLQMYYDAIEEFQKAIQITPAVSSYIGLSEVYLDIGQYEKARNILLRLMERPQGEIDVDQIRHRLAYCHISVGKFDEAYKIFGNKNTLGIQIRKAQYGLKVLVVRKNGPGDLAGFKRGDVLVEFNGIPLTAMTEKEFSAKTIGQLDFGAKTKFKIYRNGYYDDLYVYPGISPAIYELAFNDPDCSKQRKAAGNDAADAKVNIAVMNLNAHGVAEEDAIALSSRLRSILFNAYRYNVLERENMQDILGEQALQQAGATTDDNLVKAGKLLNVKYIIGGSISKIGESHSISLRMINVETGTIEAMATEEIRGTIEDVYTEGLRNAAYKLIR